MKILISSDLGPPYIGGGESYVINLGKGLINLGHEVYWLTSRIPSTKFFENYEGINIYRVPILFSKHYIFPGRQTYSLTSIFSGVKVAKQVDILQFNTLIPGPFSWILAKYVKKPSILFCHELFGPLWKKFGRGFIEKFTYPIMERLMSKAPYEKFLCPSWYSKQTLINYGTPPEKIKVIPHGIDFKLFNPKVKGEKFKEENKLEGKNLIGYTGRLYLKGTAQSKNLPMLLRSLKLIIKEVPDTLLVLGGSGFNELNKLVKKLGLEKYIRYVGQRPYTQVPEFLAAMDVVVCPAFSDGYCFLLAEASAVGKPIVATRAGAHPERVLENKTGILTDISSKSFANAVIQVLQDKKLKKKMGKEGARYASKFSWEKSVKAHLKVYEELLK